MNGWLDHRRRPGAEFGRPKRPRFLKDVFLGKNFSFHAQIFQIFSIFFRFYISLLCEMLYRPNDPFFMRKNPISENNSLMTPFLHFSYFRAHPTTLLLKIFGGRMHGPPPNSNFGGTVPSLP